MRMLLGMVYQLQGKLGIAKDEYLASIRLDPNNPATHNNFGSLLEDLDEKQEAEHEYRTALSLDPGYILGRENLARLFFEMGDPDRSELEWKQLLQVQPDNVKAHRYLGKILLAKERFAEAREIVDKAIEQGIRDDELLEMAENLKKLAGPESQEDPDD